MPLKQRSRWPVIALIALVCAFAVIVVSVVLRRSEDYSSYPQYSSLNNGDGGTKAFFNSLERLGYAADRNYKDFGELKGHGGSVFYVGTPATYFREFPGKDLDALRNVAAAGTRLMIALDAKQVEWPNVMQSPRGKQVRRNTKESANSLEDKWGVKLGRAAAEDTRFAKESTRRKQAAPAKEYVWYFASWTPEWTASGAFGDTPLFLARRFGKGTIVLMANADLLTNRQLLAGPDAGALAVAAGTRRRVTFDENHLGVANTGSVAGLATSHKLQWLLLGFGALAVFYIWRNSVSFVPPAAVERDTAVTGHSAHEALEALLRRSIPESEILGTAATEWNRSWKLEHRPGARPLNEGEMFQARAARGNEAARLYREFSKRLSRASDKV